LGTGLIGSVVGDVFVQLDGNNMESGKQCHLNALETSPFLQIHGNGGQEHHYEHELLVKIQEE
jgi:hypothetical protein